MSRPAIAVAFVALLLLGPLMIVVGLLVMSPTVSTLQKAGLPYGLGLAAGIFATVYLGLQGRLPQPPAAFSNRDIFVLVASVAVPAAVLLPLILGSDARLVIALFAAGFIAPLIPVVVIQVLRGPAGGSS